LPSFVNEVSDPSRGMLKRKKRACSKPCKYYLKIALFKYKLAVIEAAHREA